jgi:hypothetical protein
MTLTRRFLMMIARPMRICECGKASFVTRKMAKLRATQLRRPTQRMRVHRCDLSGYWHLTSYTARETAKFKDWKVGVRVTGSSAA